MNRLFILFVGLLFFASCAQITALEGGEKDTMPPQVDTLHSSPMAATNHHPTTIKLTFNEWVKVNNVLKNVLVSPPLAKRPKVTLKRKTVIFEFDKDEVLKENTTYSINFGSAIVDLTEGNVAKGLTYVFSTGDEIDSLSVRGTVVDAFTKKPVENVSVMLYENLQDSVVYKEKPYYLAITDKSGQFQINNVRAGQFKAFALKDGDFDYKFSQVDEPIGFLSDLITVGDSTPTLKFRLASERIPLKLKGKKNQLNGIKLLEFNRPPRDIEFQPIGVDDFHFREKGDSIKIWFLGADSTSQLVILSEKEVIDTITLKPKSRLKYLANQALIASGQKDKTVSVLPHKQVFVEMNLPISTWNDTLIVLTQDSLAEKLDVDIQIDSMNPQKLNIAYPWQEKGTYHLTIFPQGIKGMNNQELKDTLTQKIMVSTKEQLGNIQFTLIPPDSTKQYVVRLLKKNKEIDKVIFPQGKHYKEWKWLMPGDYSLELVEDDVPNGVWDSGKYLLGQQPERVFVKKLEKLRANWDLEVIWTPALDSEPSLLDAKAGLKAGLKKKSPKGETKENKDN